MSDTVYKQEKLENVAKCTALTGGIFTNLLLQWQHIEGSYTEIAAYIRVRQERSVLYSHCDIELVAICLRTLGLRTLPQVYGHWHRSTDTDTGLRTLTLVYGHLFWSTNTYLGLRTLILVYEHLFWSTNTYFDLRTVILVYSVLIWSVQFVNPCF